MRSFLRSYSSHSVRLQQNTRVIGKNPEILYMKYLFQYGKSLIRFRKAPNTVAIFLRLLETEALTTCATKRK